MADDIHAYFSLSYANYLVLPRTFLQSMPDEWQARFVAMLGELDQAFAHVAQPEAYIVKAARSETVAALTAAERHRAGVIVSNDEDGAVVYYDSSGAELDEDRDVLVPVPDPVPHYNRGRAYIAPAAAQEADARA